MAINVRTRSIILLAAAVLAATCSRKATDEPKEPPILDVTSWTDKSELFMEYPPFATGKTVRFAVHLTNLADFQALNAGKPSIEFTPESGGPKTVLPGTAPLRPGAFRVEGALPAAGKYRWALIVDAPNLSDRHDLGTATVFPDEASANADAERPRAEDPTAISYLKEQQWTNPFATVTVRDAEMRSSIRVPATVATLSGGEAVVGAPASGRFAASSLISVGTMVSAGQELGRLEPRLSSSEDRALLSAEVSQAQIALDASRAEQTRAEGLLQERAVPAKRVEEARRAVSAATARLQAAQARLAQRDETLRSGGGQAAGNAFVLRAPIAGRIAEVSATLGASFEEGAPLFRIVRTDRVELRAHVSSVDALSARSASEVSLEIPGAPDAIRLRVDHVHDPGVIDPKTGALPVVFEVQNPSGQLLIGQGGTAVLYRKDRRTVPAVPKTAVLTEAGRPYVWVQTGGESFARRYIEIASRDSDLIGILAGIKTGDRVVIRGAYEVQLASAMKGLPAEGHVH